MIDEKRRDTIYEEMNRYILELGDPAQYGPRYYIDKIATCRNYLNAVSLVISELGREKLIHMSELRKLESIYDLESARLLATDEHVRRMSNIKDRESMVSHILRDKKERIGFLKDQLLTVDALLKYTSHRNRELNGTMDAIKNQRRYMQIEVQTGAFYGDERVPEHEMSVGMGPAGVSIDFNEKEVAAAMDDIPEEELTAALDAAAQMGGPRLDEVQAAAPALDPVVEETPAPAPAPAPAPQVVQLPEITLAEDGEAMRAFLGDPPTVEPSTSVVQAELEDFSHLLDNV